MYFDEVQEVDGFEKVVNSLNPKVMVVFITDRTQIAFWRIGHLFDRTLLYNRSIYYRSKKYMIVVVLLKSNSSNILEQVVSANFNLMMI